MLLYSANPSDVQLNEMALTLFPAVALYRSFLLEESHKGQFLISVIMIEDFTIFFNVEQAGGQTPSRCYELILSDKIG